MFCIFNRKASGTCRKACGTRRDGKTNLASWACKPSNNTTWTVLAHHYWCQKTKQGAHHCCYGQCRSDEWYLEKYKRIAFFLFSKPKWRLKDCKAQIRACGQLHDQILDQHTWSALARPACQARGASKDVSIFHKHLTASQDPPQFFFFFLVNKNHLCKVLSLNTNWMTKYKKETLDQQISTVIPNFLQIDWELCKINGL